MAKIATYTSDLPTAEKPLRGNEIVALSTANPQVPGNATVLADFTTANTALAAACAQVEVLRGQLREAMTARQTAVATWTTKLNALAGFTLSATGGNAESIESAGFFIVPPPDGTDVHFTFDIPRGDTGADGPPGAVTESQLDGAIAGTAQNPSGIGPWTGSFSDPPTQGEMNDFAGWVESLRAALVR